MNRNRVEIDGTVTAVRTENKPGERTAAITIAFAQRELAPGLGFVNVIVSDDPLVDRAMTLKQGDEIAVVGSLRMVSSLWIHATAIKRAAIAKKKNKTRSE
jgi:hypothetical protein